MILTGRAIRRHHADRLAVISINDDGSAGLADLFATGMGANDGLEVGPDGSLYVADTYNSDVWDLPPTVRGGC